MLCANCHARVTAGDIDRQSVLVYKSNLSVLASRYGDLERRIIDRFVNDPERHEVIVDTSQVLLLDYLIADGMLAYGGAAEGALFIGPGEPPPDEESTPDSHYGPARWVLTKDGEQLVQRVRSARELD